MSLIVPLEKRHPSCEISACRREYRTQGRQPRLALTKKGSIFYGGAAGG